ncbi:hypothetical protein [uncultured Parasphingorhabdus sp.]|uniref:hypothetical protein n=1 Tax=uncultured Parasphingorhabdus sp. TaxID=2709694 RepID=UPI0030D8471E|tara:strand:- start:3688 stop:3855 length:168 start_codon:yes stop_codon:yes gene_type:complete
MATDIQGSKSRFGATKVIFGPKTGALGWFSMTRIDTQKWQKSKGLGDVLGRDETA